YIYYEVVLVLLGIYHFGQLILTTQTARMSDISNLIPGLSNKARLVEADSIRMIRVEDIEPGQLLEIESGSTVPADGLVTKGSAFVDQLVHTGEPFPAVKHPGDCLLAGSRVLDG